MTGPNPGQAVCHNQAIGDGYISVASADPLVSDAKVVGAKTEHRKGETARAGNPQGLEPILSSDTFGSAGVIQAVETDGQVIEESRAKCAVPAEPLIVRDAGLEKVLV